MGMSENDCEINRRNFSHMFRDFRNGTINQRTFCHLTNSPHQDVNLILNISSYTQIQY